MLRTPGVTLIVASRCCTTMRDESFVPPASVTTTYVVPLVIAVTRPAAETVATAEFRLIHVKLPASGAPAVSRACAASARVSPSDVSVSNGGVTGVDAIGLRAAGGGGAVAGS